MALILAPALAAHSSPRDIPLDTPENLQSLHAFQVFDKKVYVFDPASTAATIKRYSLTGRFERGLLPGGYGEDSLFYFPGPNTERGGFVVDKDGFLIHDRTKKAVLAFNPKGTSIGEYALPEAARGESFGILRREGRVMAWGKALYILSRDNPARELFSLPDGAGTIRGVVGGSEGKPYWLKSADKLYRYSYFGLKELEFELDSLLEGFRVTKMVSGRDDGVVLMAETAWSGNTATAPERKLFALDRNGEQLWESECPGFFDLAESDGLLYALEVDHGKINVRLVGPRGGSNLLFSLSDAASVRRTPLDLELDGETPLVLAGDLDHGAVVMSAKQDSTSDLFLIDDLPPNPWLPGFVFIDGELHIPCASWEDGNPPRLRQMWVRRYSLAGDLKATLGREQVSAAVTGLADGGDTGLLLFTASGLKERRSWLAMIDSESGKVTTLDADGDAAAADYLIDHTNFAGMYGDRLLVSCPSSEDENMAVRLVDLETGKHEALKKPAALDVRVLATGGNSIWVLWLDDIVYEVDDDQKFVSMYDGFRDRGLRLHETGRIRAAEALPGGGLVLLDSQRMSLTEIPEEDFARLPEFEFEEVEQSILELQAALAAYREARGNYPKRLSPEVIELAEYIDNRTALLEPFLGERILSYGIVGGDELNYELYILAGDRDQEIWKIDRNAYLPY